MKNKPKRKNRFWPFVLCLVLIAALALGMTGCKTNPPDVGYVIDGGIIGEGERVFPFSVIDQGGTETVFEVHTNQNTVGEALQELGMIAGEEGPYGLYVKRVCDITLDYEKDGYYWAFYVNGEYAASGVDKTEIRSGETYRFQAVKG